jgi:two-component system chemotaxis response regulator CheB
MPENAIRAVNVDHIVPLAEMADLLVRLSNEEVPAEAAMQVKKEEKEKTDIEVGIAAQDNAFERGVMKLGELSPFTCPDCHGVLSELTDGKLKRYRCHTGHAYSPDTLLATVTEHIEEDMWNTIRSVEESVMLLNHMGDHFAEVNSGKLAAAYFAKANEAMERIKLLREAVMSHETLSIENIDVESDGAGESSQVHTSGRGESTANADASS